MNSQDPLVSVTANASYPCSRVAEWMRGTRPLPGMDASFYFRQSAVSGLITEDESLELHRRHLQLLRQEEAAVRGELICKTCHGEPPAGFACRTCGAEGVDQ